KVLDECRLYREEQLQITEEVMRARNSIEWLIRINKVINNFIYARRSNESKKFNRMAYQN
ncbi:hypothetical protein, partial [Roseburia sp. AF25-25LB]|uniref:hypothetical protein n=1 Tax=Roseburia sp. AF25-25LB TaxID=2293135 RepID=UPI001A9B266E